jgi:hypothetical protein
MDPGNRIKPLTGQTLASKFAGNSTYFLQHGFI